MKCWVGLGSNLGGRKENLENAARALMGKAGRAQLRAASVVVESPALVPTGAPAEWRKPFLNAVLEIEWAGSPPELLRCLKEIEISLGREPAPRWAPRAVDLDLLKFGEQAIAHENLRVPHPEISRRQFVLAPWKHLASSLRWAPGSPTVLERTRQLPGPIPLWMGILNLTPDSFSDGRALAEPGALEKQLDAFAGEHTQILDLGGESTRPGANPVGAAEEWRRLDSALERVLEKNRGQIFRPLVSVDTHRAETAAKALARGADIINDVSGLADPAMIEVLRNSACQYVLMHSLTVPADPRVQLAEEDPVGAVKEWACRKLEFLEREGISLHRVIFDPGIGFGKSAAQALALLREVDRFLGLPVRLRVGHSRKSFLSGLGGGAAPSEREAETLGASLRLAERGVDILRVHSPHLHQRALRVFREI